MKKARSQIAALVGADRLGSIIFTLGATEATKIALRGLALAPGSRCVTSAIEHACVRETLADLARDGVVTTEVPVGADGIVDLDALSEAIATEPALVTLMAVNNEVGTIQPFREAAQSCQAVGAAFHSDMSQALGRMPIDLAGDEISMASFSAHKIGGPQGIGALCIANWVDLRPSQVEIRVPLDGRAAGRRPDPDGWREEAQPGTRPRRPALGPASAHRYGK